MANDAANIKIEPMDVIVGEDVAQIQTITCVADDDDSLDGKYFFLYSALNAIKYHVWFNTDGGSATDPDPGGSTAQSVALSTDDTAGSVATALASAIDGLAGFTASANGSVVTVTNAAAGYATPAHEGVGTGFSFSLSTQGDREESAGYIEGEIEISGLAEDLEPITAHQEGTNVLGHIRKGHPELSVSMSFKETSKAQLRRAFLPSGGTHTPAGAGGTELFGLGSSKQFTSTLSQAKPMRLHPIKKSASDKSEDINFWKTYLNLDTLTFSGEGILTLPVSVMIYPDSTKPAAIRFFAIGDGSQL